MKIRQFRDYIMDALTYLDTEEEAINHRADSIETIDDMGKNNIIALMEDGQEYLITVSDITKVNEKLDQIEIGNWEIQKLYDNDMDDDDLFKDDDEEDEDEECPCCDCDDFDLCDMNEAPETFSIQDIEALQNEIARLKEDNKVLAHENMEKKLGLSVKEMEELVDKLNSIPCTTFKINLV